MRELHSSLQKVKEVNFPANSKLELWRGANIRSSASGTNVGMSSLLNKSSGVVTKRERNPTKKNCSNSLKLFPVFFFGWGDH